MFFSNFILLSKDSTSYFLGLLILYGTGDGGGDGGCGGGGFANIFDISSSFILFSKIFNERLLRIEVIVMFCFVDNLNECRCNNIGDWLCTSDVVLFS